MNTPNIIVCVVDAISVDTYQWDNITSDSEEVLSLLMLDGTYLSIIFATLGPFLTFPPPEAVYVVANIHENGS